ncbi:hypothetical protein F5B17DRAFT_161068 [Nemania serpens]|nr:hypothetical protein F5B17DRAFT_161068 [Nemania serpens]
MHCSIIKAMLLVSLFGVTAISRSETNSSKCYQAMGAMLKRFRAFYHPDAHRTATPTSSMLEMRAEIVDVQRIPMRC